MKIKIFCFYLLFLTFKYPYAQSERPDIEVAFEEYSNSIIEMDLDEYLYLIHPRLFKGKNRKEISRTYLKGLKKYRKETSTKSFMVAKNISKLGKLKNMHYRFIDYLMVREIKLDLNSKNITTNEGYYRKKHFKKYNRKQSFQSRIASYDSINKIATIVSYDRVLALKDSNNLWKFIPRRKEMLFGLGTNYENILHEFLSKRIIKKLKTIRI
ncbi:hypothetical protein [Ichthyenterobacterium magnum]|uniref:Uncharacterized protein n=1 Tax=Ichthyenterobacterium magnum TaxID=1230530 RepID=A0A420DGM5_9FLAO|nr:hypothetical protein [Ichthyenterobacterium magnum]RKE92241.1 hypothetical protein BXY80_2159 [Ichthyenterobacterium magnum]